MLDSEDVLQPNIMALLLLLIVLSQYLIGQDRSNYRRLALQFHPDRQPTPQDESCCDPNREESRRSAFAVVAEAYDVLSDPHKKLIYETYGEEGLKNGFCGPEGTVKPYVFHGEPLRTYREFFGTENPFANLLDKAANPPPIEECDEKKKDEPIIMPLPLSLDEVFHGGIKKMKIERMVLEGDGDNKKTQKTTLEEKILSIPIMPGMPSGAKIVFPELGDQSPTTIPADIVFVTEDKPHETFRRDGSNLRLTVNVFLNDALTGTIVKVHTIDDRILRVPITSVISPDYVKTVAGEGLPLVEDPEQRGDLVIDFKIEFPSYLSAASRGYVQKAFDDKLANRADEDDGAISAGGRRMVLADRLYMRSDKLAQICRP